MFSLFPIAHAQATSLSDNPAVKSIIDGVMVNVITPILGVLFLFSFATFVYGIFKMIANPDDSDERSNAKSSILWSSIGMVIMVSGYGIIRVIASTLAPVGVVSPFH